MKRICEIYDISKDYEMPTGTVLIIVSDIEKDKIISILLNTKLKEDMVFNNTEWQEYHEFNGFVYKTQGNVVKSGDQYNMNLKIEVCDYYDWATPSMIIYIITIRKGKLKVRV